MDISFICYKTSNKTNYFLKLNYVFTIEFNWQKQFNRDKDKQTNKQAKILINQS